MNRLRLSSDILSPINSDISFNDTSAFSFGNLPSTPDFEDIESPKTKLVNKSSNIDSFCKKTMKESASAFDMIVNDIKKQSNINAEKEEKYKESYEMFKNSMDALFYTVSDSSVLSSISNKADLEKGEQEEKIPSEIEADDISVTAQKVKVPKISGFTKSKTHTDISKRKSRKKELCIINQEKESNQQTKSVQPSKKSKENIKQSKILLEHGYKIKRSDSVTYKASKMVSSSTQTCGHFETMGAKGKDNLKTVYSQKQKNAAVLNSVPASENKGLSIEKAIEIAVGVEMDNLRRFTLEQNLCIRKDLLNLQETVKKQNAATNYLFSVIEALIEENKKLILKNT